jgi:hypothetical protein
MLEHGREELWQALLKATQAAVPKIRGVAHGLRGQGQDEAARILDEAMGQLASAALACLDTTERIDAESLYAPGEDPMAETVRLRRDTGPGESR